MKKAQFSTLLITAGLLTGCSSSAGVPIATTPPTTSATVTAEPTRSSTTPVPPATRDAESAQVAVTAFWGKLDDVGINPKLSLDTLATVARDQALQQWTASTNTDRSLGYRQTGRAVVSPVSVKHLGKNQFEVVSCVDVSRVNVVDRDGKSVIAANRPARAEYSYQVEQDAQKFYVTRDTFKPVGEC